MKHYPFKNDHGFISFSMYIILIYLIGIYIHFYNRIMMVTEIRGNFISIYQEYINQLMK
jgi:hypothetical protein